MPPEQTPAFAAAPVPSLSTKPQKSSLWIWTTLWLTTFFDALLVIIVYLLLMHFLQQAVSISPTVVTFIDVIANAIALCIGSYLAAGYVLKRARIMKTEAGKYAGLSIIVPVIFLLAELGLSVYLLKGNISLVGLIEKIAEDIIYLAPSYLIIRMQLEKKGE